MLNSMQLKVRFSTIVLLFGINYSVAAQCIDSDGDGWGWDGVSSCRAEIVENICVDSPPVGDGWGWNGVTSCQIAVSNPVCVDSPPVGDGWGWDGVSSCRVGSSVVPNPGSVIVTDLNPNGTPAYCVDTAPVGDGWGWDGNASCAVVPNLIKNGGFEDLDAFWTTYVHPDAVDTRFEISNTYNDLRLFYKDAGSKWWHSQAYSAPFTIEAGKSYRLEFNHESSSRTGNAVGSVVIENATTYNKHLERQDFSVGIGAVRTRIDFTAAESDNNARLTFNLGDNAGGSNSAGIGVIWLDDIILIPLD